MALIRFNKQSFVAAMEPGITSYVVQQFQDRIESKLNAIVDEVYEELKRDMPDKIKTKILNAINVASQEDHYQVNVEVNFGEEDDDK